MSLWDIGEEKIEKTGSFEMGVGDMEPIPSNTELLAYIEQAKWDEFEEQTYVSLKWKVAKPEEYKGRVLFHKLKVCDLDEKKRTKAVKMLAAIDTNCKGKLLGIEFPKDADLMKCLANQMMRIKVQIWKMAIKGEDREGNWISSVAPKGVSVEEPKPVQAPAKPVQPAADNCGTTSEDFDVPF